MTFHYSLIKGFEEKVKNKTLKYRRGFISYEGKKGCIGFY